MDIEKVQKAQVRKLREPEKVVATTPIDDQRYLARKVNGRECDRCGERRYACPKFGYPEGTPESARYAIDPVVVAWHCLPCSVEDFAADYDAAEPEHRAYDEAHRVRRAVVEEKVKPAGIRSGKVVDEVKGQGSFARPSLTPEGNVPLVMRVIKEQRAAGRSKKGTLREVRKVFKALYAKLGRTGSAWINSRTRLYSGRALEKLGGWPERGQRK